MAFDGIMMTMVRREMSDALIGSRVNQIYQPARDELVFAFRTQDGAKKVLIRLSEFYQTSVDYLLGLTDRREPYPRR